MNLRSFGIMVVFALTLFAAGTARAQSADNDTPITPGVDGGRRQSRSFIEMMNKMRIEREKKDYEQLLERGEEALKLSNDLETAIESKSGLSELDRAQLDRLEKLIKKIRSDIGGGDDDEKEADGKPATLAEGFTKLKDATATLVDELKKMTRFSISAAAIQTSNSILRLTRFLKFGK